MRRLVTPTALLAAYLGMLGPVDAEIQIRRAADGKVVATNSRPGAYAPAPARPVARIVEPAPLASPAPEPVERLIQDVSRDVGMSPDLIRAVVSVESAFDPEAVSRKGARGLMQLMPATATAYGVQDPHDPRENLQGGTEHLRDLLRQYRGDLALALAAYNAGPEAVRRYQGVPPYPETRDYVRRVMAIYEESRDAMPEAPPPDPRGLYSYRDARGNLVMSNVAARNGSLPVRRAGLPR